MSWTRCRKYGGGPGSVAVARCVPCALVLLVRTARGAALANPPEWPSTVRVFGAEDSVADIEAAVNAAFATNGGHEPPDNGQFSRHRYAFLFKPGTYDVEVPVGYYTQVAGLGALPSDVVFTSPKGVYCEEGTYTVTVGALNTFWRSAENFQTDANYAWINGRGSGMMWAASQASPLRRLSVTNNLFLYEYREGEMAGDYSSGGFLANSNVKGNVLSGSQQQFFVRNCVFGSWEDGVWNMVFVGTQGAPRAHCGAEDSMPPYTTVDATPVVAEKPFISVDAKTGRYSLNIPRLRTQSSGVDQEEAVKVDFEHVYVADAMKDTCASINAMLGQGLHVVLSPGIYELSCPLQLGTANQVLLGLGLATLVAAKGTAAVEVGNVDGCRVAGVLLEAGSSPTETLLRWGEGAYPGNAQNPGLLHDVFMRVGGPSTPSPVQARTMLQINSGHVIGDNLWLWRADHTEDTPGVKNGDNPCDVAAIVNGDDVTMYGLAAEHTLQDLVQWNGDRGVTYFFQAELPYDVNESYGDLGFVGYRVADQVTQHASFGAGVYHFFRDHPVVVASGIAAPSCVEDFFVSPVAVFLNGVGTMRHIINDRGASTQSDGDGRAVPEWLCPSSASNGTCNVGDVVACPGSSITCQGDACCPDGSTCPSAKKSSNSCPNPKAADCTSPGPRPSPPVPPAPGSSCRIGDIVDCPAANGVRCMGDQCCPDGTICPSANGSFTDCAQPKSVDCTRPSHTGPPLPAGARASALDVLVV